MCRIQKRRIASFWAILAAMTMLAAIVPSFGHAADAKFSAASLGKIPADAEAYGAVFSLGETIEMIGKSRAWKMLWEEPAVQDLWKKALEKWDKDDSPKKFFNDPANKDLPSLAADAFSHEVFIYVGAGCGDVLSLGQEMVGSFRFGPAFQKLLGGGNGDPTRERIRGILQVLSAKPERLRVPDLVIGFKVSDPKKVTAQVKRLDKVLAEALKETPLKGRSKVTRVDGDDFLVLDLDGSLVPWDLLPLGMFEDKPNEFGTLLDYLKKMKLTVSIGVRQGYLLIALGESANRVMKFGGPGPKLVDRPEFKPLAKFASRRITSLGFTSEKLRQAVATTPEDIAGMGELAKGILKLAELPDELETAIDKDIDSLAKHIGKGFRKPGASASFSFRTERGWETYDYDYTEPESREQRPLTLLNHVGGDPLLAAVWRSGTTIEDHKELVKWLTVFSKHAEKAVALKVPNGEEYVKKYRTEYLPIFNEFGDITEKLWLPALADGQQAFVLDAKWTSNQWHLGMPQTNIRLPMPEIGVALGVSDPDKLGQALEAYRGVANKLLMKARGEVPAGQIPDFEITKPKIVQDRGNTFAFYPIPPELGLDAQFQPTGGLSKNVAALTLSRAHTTRLLSEIPLKTGSVVLEDAKQPLDSMFHFNWTGIVDAASPWAHQIIATQVPPPERENAERIAEKVIKLLRVFRSYTSVTYRDGKTTVTHSEAVFGDIEP